jgi:DNA-binding GntR family transcriptional regulator
VTGGQDTAARDPEDATHAGTLHRRRLSPARGALYRQIASDLRAQLAEGNLAPGDRLPPEAELGSRYGVSRLTVRRALEDLARSGLVRTEHGVGSFIASPALRHRIDDGHASLYESMSSRGITVRHHVLEIKRLHTRALKALLASPAVAADFAAPVFPAFPGPVVRFRFVRYVEEEPWSIGEVYVPAQFAPTDWDGGDSVFTRMSAQLGITVRRTERAFAAGPASPEEATWLEVPVGAALLVMRGINTDDQDRVIATIAHRIRGDRAEYVMRLPR